MASPAIRAFHYDPDRNELTVRFGSSRAYVYSLVPPDVFAAFEQAASKGAFHNTRIRDRYPFRKTKVAPETPSPSLRDALIGSSRG